MFGDMISQFKPTDSMGLSAGSTAATIQCKAASYNVHHSSSPHLATRQHRALCRLHRHHLDVGVLLLQVLADTGDGAAGADARNDNVNLAGGVAPNLRSCAQWQGRSGGWGWRVGWRGRGGRELAAGVGGWSEGSGGEVWQGRSGGWGCRIGWEGEGVEDQLEESGGRGLAGGKWGRRMVSREVGVKYGREVTSSSRHSTTGTAACAPPNAKARLQQHACTQQRAARSSCT